MYTTNIIALVQLRPGSGRDSATTLVGITLWYLYKILANRSFHSQEECGEGGIFARNQSLRQPKSCPGCAKIHFREQNSWNLVKIQQKATFHRQMIGKIHHRSLGLREFFLCKVNGGNLRKIHVTTYHLSSIAFKVKIKAS